MDLKREYPILFSEQGILTDFTGFELESRFLERMQLCAEKLKEEGMLRKRKSVVDILKQNVEPNIEALIL